MDKILYAVASDRNFVKNISPKSNQSEFFYFENTINGSRLLPIDLLIFDIDAFFLGYSICNIREYKIFADFVSYADALLNSNVNTLPDNEYSRILDSHLHTIVEMLSPSFMASSIIVNETSLNDKLLKASSLIATLESLQNFQTDTQALINDVLTKTMREVKKTSMILN